VLEVLGAQPPVDDRHRLADALGLHDPLLRLALLDLPSVPPSPRRAPAVATGTPPPCYDTPPSDSPAIPSGPAVRCFIAIDLTTDVRAAIARAETRVRTAARDADVRWVDPAQFHLTLKFLGAVPDDRVPAVSAALEGAVADTAPIALAAAGLGGFPSLRSARVLWAGIAAGVPELARLAAAIDRALTPLGFPPEGRPFRVHLTIGPARQGRVGPSPENWGPGPGVSCGGGCDMSIDVNRERAIDLAVSQIEKQFGKGAIMKLGEEALAQDVACLPTGSLGLDIALGIGGIPRGRVVEIYGPESSGKTTLALQLIRSEE